MFIDDLARAIGLRVVGNSFVQHNCCAIEQGVIDDIRVPGNSANTGIAPEHFAGLVGKNIVKSHAGAGQITAGGMYDAFRFAGRAGGVKNKQWIFSTHLDGGALRSRTPSSAVITILARNHQCARPGIAVRSRQKPPSEWPQSGCKHGNDYINDHGHINDSHITPDNSLLFQGIGKATHALV